MNKYKLSIIVPCYNCSATIERLLDSIVNNDLDKKDYQLIIVNDNSNDNFLDLVKPYESRANIYYYDTNTNIHCPGNTRQVGLDNAQGEWIMFIDNDDYIELGIFRKIFRYIKDNKIDTVLCTSFNRIYSENYTESFPANEYSFQWLHGNIYNRKFLLDNNIKFAKDICYCEDVYFNNLIGVNMFVLDLKIHYLKELYTYNWVYSDTSLSNQKIDLLNPLYAQFDNYIRACSEPAFVILDKYPNDFHIKNEMVTCLIWNFIMGYFYCQAGIYELGFSFPRKNLLYLAELRDKILNKAAITADEFIQIVYNNPQKYLELKDQSINATCDFIELESFRDFFLHL